jgi:hypothetical protein
VGGVAMSLIATDIMWVANRFLATLSPNSPPPL